MQRFCCWRNHRIFIESSLSLLCPWCFQKQCSERSRNVAICRGWSGHQAKHGLENGKAFILSHVNEKRECDIRTFFLNMLSSNIKWIFLSSCSTDTRNFRSPADETSSFGPKGRKSGWRHNGGSIKMILFVIYCLGAFLFYRKIASFDASE